MTQHKVQLLLSDVSDSVTWQIEHAYDLKQRTIIIQWCMWLNDMTTQSRVVTDLHWHDKSSIKIYYPGHMHKLTHTADMNFF